MGGIYQLGDDFSTMLKRQIERKSQSFVVSGTTRVPVNPGQPSAMMMLADDNDAQYIINGQITDLTSTLDQKLLKSDQINRQFAATLEIMDGKTGGKYWYRTIIVKSPNGPSREPARLILKVPASGNLATDRQYSELVAT